MADMIGFSHQARTFEFTLALGFVALIASGCDNDAVLGSIDVGISPQSGTISPCGPTIADAWAFRVSAGDEVMISVDTVDAETAADFEVRGVCGSSDFFFADDNFLCTFPPPAFSCPATVFTATTDGNCVLDVSPALTGLNPPSAACSDPDRADYQLFVDLGGAPALLVQIRDSSDLVCMGGMNNSRSCGDDDDCPGGSCEAATSLESSLKRAVLP
jgi:hypothetical protein